MGVVSVSGADPIITASVVRAEKPRLPAFITDQWIDDAIRRGWQRIQRYCGWHVAPVVTETRVLDGGGGPSLFLQTGRLTDVASVTVDGFTEPGVEWSENGFLRRASGGRWPNRLRNVSVTFTHGYEPDDVDDLVGVLIDMVERAATVPSAVSQQSTGDVSLSYSADGSLRPTQGDREVLAAFRIRVSQ